ncbi:recombinase family protein [Streptomyces sp. PSKA30]|uniref:recombinase family protein n=1 Tax=Streptomyces sp. PSKA30 TaxID=2874597 RepID=UPI001CD0C670|nr:recombinase family protein [Streptomyces sp. PSKA30]MBZ9644750.1 recombinase family protein [Streptomyces sp. PSKA30]
MFTVLAALSSMGREYIRDRTLEGHESARKRGKTIGGASVTDEPRCPWPSTCATRR